MKVRRLLALAVTGSSLLAALLAVAWGCGTDHVVTYDCALGTPGETGADGGPNPCHCATPGGGDCACTSPDEFQNSGFSGKQLFQFCLQSLEDAGDGAEGGPLLACNGQCWPIQPDPSPNQWTAPQLLWVGTEIDPQCPGASPAPVWGGYGSGTFALACTSNASGACSDPGAICGPANANGFATCVSQAGDVACPLVGQYVNRQLFYEAAGQPLDPTTFCCIAAPSIQ